MNSGLLSAGGQALDYAKRTFNLPATLHSRENQTLLMFVMQLDGGYTELRPSSLSFAESNEPTHV